MDKETKGLGFLNGAEASEYQIKADRNGDDSRATALISMTKNEKQRLTVVAKVHGLSLSAFLRLAADEYIAKHEW